MLTVCMTVWRGNHRAIAEAPRGHSRAGAAQGQRGGIARYPVGGQVCRINHPRRSQSVPPVAQSQRQAVARGQTRMVAGGTADGLAHEGEEKEGRKWTQRPSASRHSTDRSLAAARRPTTVPKTGPTLRRQYPQGLRTMCQIDLYYKCGLIGANLG